MSDETVIIKYTGEYPVSIISDNIGGVEPGETFPVPADRAASYTSRPDMVIQKAPATASSSVTPTEPAGSAA